MNSLATEIDRQRIFANPEAAPITTLERHDHETSISSTKLIFLQMSAMEPDQRKAQHGSATLQTSDPTTIVMSQSNKKGMTLAETVLDCYDILF